MTGTLRDVRDQKAQPRATPDLNDVKFAGDENRKVMPSSGKLVTPDPGNVPEGQTTRG
ncbi:MAG: hypothetical protein JO256_14265 [Alphaproteobacteria bacterium]|nr:hypothetical protein [Alphaproteobacteria bacterium]